MRYMIGAALLAVTLFAGSAGMVFAGRGDMETPGQDRQVVVSASSGSGASAGGSTVAPARSVSTPGTSRNHAEDSRSAGR